MDLKKFESLSNEELKNINGGGTSDVGEWLMDRVADVYVYFFCNHNNGYYFDKNPQHTH